MDYNFNNFSYIPHQNFDSFLLYKIFLNQNANFTTISRNILKMRIIFKKLFHKKVGFFRQNDIMEPNDQFHESFAAMNFLFPNIVIRLFEN